MSPNDKSAAAEADVSEDVVTSLGFDPVDDSVTARASSGHTNGNGNGNGRSSDDDNTHDADNLEGDRGWVDGGPSDLGSGSGENNVSEGVEQVLVSDAESSASNGIKSNESNDATLTKSARRRKKRQNRKGRARQTATSAGHATEGAVSTAAASVVAAGLDDKIADKVSDTSPSSSAGPLDSVVDDLEELEARAAARVAAEEEAEARAAAELAAEDAAAAEAGAAEAAAQQTAAEQVAGTQAAAESPATIHDVPDISDVFGSDTYVDEQPPVDPGAAAYSPGTVPATTGEVPVVKVDSPPLEIPENQPAVVPAATPTAPPTAAQVNARLVPTETVVVAEPVVHGEKPSLLREFFGNPFDRKSQLQARKVRRVVRHIDPWSVLTFSVLFHMCVFAALLLASVLVWNVAEAAGTIENVENFILELGDYESFEISGEAIFRAGVAIAGIMTLTSSVMVVLLTVVFNLLSDLIGGIRVTVIEEETVRVHRK